MYACEELVQFSKRKDYISTKLAFEKTAEGYDWGGGIAGGIATGVGVTGVGVIRQAIGALSDVIKDKFYSEPLRKQLFKDIVTKDPIVSRFEMEQPGMAANAFSTMKHFAPELSTDPHVVTAFLRNTAMSGGALDHNMIKGLADAEQSVHKAIDSGMWYPGIGGKS